MDFFDFLFGKGKNKSDEADSISQKNFNHIIDKEYSSIDPVEQLVKESIIDLKKHIGLSTERLEAEAIYLAAYLYMKNTYRIDFDLDYITDGLIEKVPSGDYGTSDKVFKYMKQYGEGFYGDEEIMHGINGYRLNMQLRSDYGDLVKAYFKRAHGIGADGDFIIFSSPRNCLWRDNIKAIDSPTHRDIYYKFQDNSFEFMIPPYNPLVKGKFKKIDDFTIRCESDDGRRTFIFHYDGGITPDNLNYIEMYRNDKGDMVSYHKV